MINFINKKKVIIAFFVQTGTGRKERRRKPPVLPATKSYIITKIKRGIPQ